MIHGSSVKKNDEPLGAISSVYDDELEACIATRCPEVQLFRSGGDLYVRGKSKNKSAVVWFYEGCGREGCET